MDGDPLEESFSNFWRGLFRCSLVLQSGYLLLTVQAETGTDHLWFVSFLCVCWLGSHWHCSFDREDQKTSSKTIIKSIWQSAKCSSSFPWILCGSPVAIRLKQQGSSHTHSTNICQYYFSSGMETKSLWNFICVHFWDENVFAILDKVNTKKMKIKSKYLIINIIF